MEDFYRWQRTRLGYLIDHDGEPAGGRWNFDDENREPPPKGDANPWADPQTSQLDEVDREVLADLDRAADDHGIERGAPSRTARGRRLDAPR